MNTLNDIIIFRAIYPHIAKRNARKRSQKEARVAARKTARKIRVQHTTPRQDVIYPRKSIFPGYKGHNIILWTLLAPVTLAIPLIYWTISKKHYWHF